MFAYFSFVKVLGVFIAPLQYNTVTPTPTVTSQAVYKQELDQVMAVLVHFTSMKLDKDFEMNCTLSDIFALNDMYKTFY